MSEYSRIRQQTIARCYLEGAVARDEGKSAMSCPYGVLDGFERGWWFAGWNDRDMEKRNG